VTPLTRILPTFTTSRAFGKGIVLKLAIGEGPPAEIDPLQAVASDCYRAAIMTADEASGSGQASLAT
jgi:hypothetical protein